MLHGSLSSILSRTGYAEATFLWAQRVSISLSLGSMDLIVFGLVFNILHVVNSMDVFSVLVGA